MSPPGRGIERKRLAIAEAMADESRFLQPEGNGLIRISDVRGLLEGP